MTRPAGSTTTLAEATALEIPTILIGHRTSYLWEQVWERDALLDILNRFVHVEPTPKGKANEGAIIFPRYHQWDAVLRVADHARANGAGNNYLVQHSAGSGKSNTIAWLAHRLSTLHNDTDTKVFNKVIVITDRKVLDRQMQATVGQFEKVAGVVQKIDENSAQLAAALEGEQARIIITTIQKFPFVLDKIGTLPDRRYAVIADEAHSSQSGETSKELKLVLGGGAVDSETALALAEQEELGSISEVPDPVQDKLAADVAARGHQHNLSFFAFTATPKAKTLEMFGTKVVGLDGKLTHIPFHLYSMRQAIQEGYIHDVLANYTTYQTYWNIEKKAQDDPEYDPGPGQGSHCQVREPARAQPHPEGRHHHQPLPQQGGGSDRGEGQSHGGHRIPAACPALRVGASQVLRRQRNR